MAKPFTVRRRVEFVDTDMAGIMHFSNYFRMMESAEQEFLRARGLTVAWMQDGQRVGFPRVSASCDYSRALRFEDVVEIVVSIERVGQKSVTYNFAFSCAGEPIANGRITTCCSREATPGSSMVSIEIPEEIRKKLEVK